MKVTGLIGWGLQAGWGTAGATCAPSGLSVMFEEAGIGPQLNSSRAEGLFVRWVHPKVMTSEFFWGVEGWGVMVLGGWCRTPSLEELGRRRRMPEKRETKEERIKRLRRSVPKAVGGEGAG